MHLARTILLTIALLVVSCVTLPTPSGQPEVIINKGQRASFTSALMNDLLNEKWSIAEQGADFIVFELITGETMQMFWNGRAMRPRARLNFVDIRGRVRVVANLTVSTRNFLGGQSEEPVFPTKYILTWQNRMKRAAGQ